MSILFDNAYDNHFSKYVFEPITSRDNLGKAVRSYIKDPALNIPDTFIKYESSFFDPDKKFLLNQFLPNQATKDFPLPQSFKFNKENVNEKLSMGLSIKTGDFYYFKKHGYSSFLTPDFVWDRDIIWVFDPCRIGGQGKTTWAKLIYEKFGCVGLNWAKSDDLLYARSTCPQYDITICDFTRSKPKQIDSYGVYSSADMEVMKNALYLSTKYESGTVRTRPPFMIAFSNTLPTIVQMSQDRWKILRIGNVTKMLIPMSKTQVNFFWSDYVVYLKEKEVYDKLNDAKQQKKAKKGFNNGYFDKQPIKVDEKPFFDPMSDNLETVHAVYSDNVPFKQYVPSDYLLFEYGD